MPKTRNPSPPRGVKKSSDPPPPERGSARKMGVRNPRPPRGGRGSEYWALPKGCNVVWKNGKLQFLLEFGVYFSNIHGMTLKMFFSGVGTIRRCKKKKFWIFNHFWLRYGSSKIKNHGFYVFLENCFFFWSSEKMSKNRQKLEIWLFQNFET